MSGGRQTERTNLLIAVVAIGGGIALAGAFLADPPSFDRATLTRAAILTALTAVAELVAIRLKHGESGELITLFELAVVADIVLLPPGLAPLAGVGGLAIALLIQRRPLVKFAFNLGQYALGVMPAVALYQGLGHGDFQTTRGLLAMAAGMALFTGVNLLTISAIISATTHRPLRKVLVEEQGISIAMGLGNSAVGMVATSLYLSQPALLPAVLAPTLALHLAFRGWVQEKELSRQMEDEKTKLGRILQHSSEGIVLADGDGTVVLWSPSMERATGVPSSEAVGKAVAYLLRGRGHFGQPLVVDVSRETEPLELEIVATDGTARWLRVQHGPGFDARGALSFDVLVVTDITRQREVDRLKEDFFSTVSHELRTPLTPIKGYASLLLRRMDEIPVERRREALQSILERTDHMTRLVEDMLLASRIASAGERRLPEVKRQPVEVVSLVERTVRTFSLSHPLRDLRVRGDAPVIGLVDPIRLEQIVANVVSNAIKFSDDGTTVEVSVEVRGVEVAIVVRDEGRGIPRDHFEDIFDKFRRIEDPLTMETGGAGLGLYIVRKLAVAMGGTVSVESEVGRGSTFTVLLPAEPQAVTLEDRRVGDVSA